MHLFSYYIYGLFSDTNRDRALQNCAYPKTAQLFFLFIKDFFKLINLVFEMENKILVIILIIFMYSFKFTFKVQCCFEILKSLS